MTCVSKHTLVHINRALYTLYISWDPLRKGGVGPSTGSSPGRRETALKGQGVPSRPGTPAVPHQWGVSGRHRPLGSVSRCPHLDVRRDNDLGLAHWDQPPLSSLFPVETRVFSFLTKPPNP